MEKITNRTECLLIAKKLYSRDAIEFLSSWRVKELLDRFFRPDSYSFFVDGDFVIPLVQKNNTAYFFGGNLPFNDYNIIPDNPALLNFALESLLNLEIDFRLTSIKNDYFDLVDPRFKPLDVPFNQNWTIEDIGNFKINDFIISQKKKKRDKIKRGIRLLDKFKFIEVSNESYVENYLDTIFELSCKSFEERGKDNCWSNNRELYNAFFEIFFEDGRRGLNKILVDERSGEIIASYNLSLSNSEIFLSFSNCYKMSIEYIQFLIYFDIIQSASNLAKEVGQNLSLNAGRGNFGYKSRMGFKPSPMYALVKDKSWIVERNKDLVEEDTRFLYGREFGCFL